ncbi:MAG: MFS transporter [Myxococcota bacterium]|nr:MFS transporter [Myxococcota bacterium]
MQSGQKPPVFDDNERRIVHFTGFAHAATHYVELVFPTLAVGLAAQTGISLEVVLSWSFVSYLLFGLGALPAGMAADRFGARPVIFTGLLTAGLGACIAGSVAPGWPLATALATVGAGASLYHPAGTGLLSRAIVQRGRALGINGIYGNIGIALSPLVTFALATAIGWRLTLWTTGLVILAGTFLFQRLQFTEPPRGESNPESPRNETAALSRHGIIVFVVLCVAATLGGFIYRGNVVAEPALFSENIFFINYGLAASIALLIGIAGQYLGGLMADRHELRMTYLGFHLAALPALAAMGLLASWPLLLVASLYSFFSLGMQPIENSLFAALTPERWRSTAYGLKFVFTFGLGSTAVFLVRGVAETSSWSHVYLALAGVGVALVFCIGLLIVLTWGRPARNT